MSEDLPQRKIHYTTNNSDTARWDHFSGRDDDIFVCTPPRSSERGSQDSECLKLPVWQGQAWSL